MSTLAYKKHLEEKKGEDVSVDRRDTSIVKGRVDAVSDEAVEISYRKPGTVDARIHTFVALDDIRGVSIEGWDHDIIAH
ncbi:MAG TPA: hypothetical protein PLD99_01035 [Parcubacteria group bacterium]|nr:hypothetical protein [Parcubacteria group bacterium]